MIERGLFLSIESELQQELDRAVVEARLFGESGDPVRLGRFEVKRRLGRGANGVVYEAFDPERACAVALKLLRFPDPKGVYRLKREFRSLAEIAHVNLIALYELFHEQERWFFSMELVNGVALDTWVRPLCGELDEGRLRSAFGQLSQAVSAIHATGKLHCDLKPSNVLVTEQGRVVVLDFGLVSEQVASGSAALQTGLVGTPAYIAPERAAGNGPTPLGDWYAVGVMLFEVLVGRLPFEGDPLQVLSAKQREEAPDPRESCGGRVPDELCRLCAGLLRREPGQRPPPDAVLAALQGARPLAAAPVARASASASAGSAGLFVGRDAELQALHAALSAARTKQTTVALVGGPSGVGKSALLERFAAGVGADVLVLRGRCHEQESIPYKVFDPIVDALGAYLRELPIDKARLLMPRHVQSLLRLFPGLGRVEAFHTGARADATALDARELRSQAFAALKELLLRLTDQVTVVVVVDDLQWGDLDSVRMMEHVLGSPEPPPLLFVGAYRDDDAESSEFVQELLGGQLLGSAQPRVVALGPLPTASAVALARELLRQASISAHEDAAAELAAEADGMPFLIGELVAHLEVTSTDRAPRAQPVSLEQAILSRVGALQAPARSLVQVLSVAAGPLEQGVALEAAGLAAGDQLVFQALRVARLLRTRGGRPADRVETYHDRVRELVVRNLPVELVRAIHGRIVEAMVRHGVTEPERLMMHLVGAGDRERAAEAAVRAAHVAVAKLAFNRAAELFAKAIALMPEQSARSFELHRQMGTALAHAGRGGRAAEAYLVAAGGLAPEPARELRRLAAQQFLRSGRIQEGTDLARQLFREVGLRYPDTRAGAIVQLLWHRSRLARTGPGLRRLHANRAPEVLVERLATVGAVYQELSACDQVRGALLHAQFLRDAMRAGDSLHALRGLAWEVFHLSIAPNNEHRALEVLDVIEELQNELGTPYALATREMARAAFELFSGRYQAALDPARRAERVFRDECVGASFECSWSSALKYWSLEFAGDLREMTRETPQRIRDAAERDDHFTIGLLVMSVVKSQLAADEPTLAMEFLDEQREKLGPGSTTFHQLVIHRTADTLLYQGSGTQALRYLQRHWPDFKSSPAYRGRLMRAVSHYLRARCVFAGLLESGTQGLAAIVDRDLKVASRLGCLSGLPSCLQAAVSYHQGDADAARAAMLAGLKQLNRDHLERYAACAKRRLGEMTPGDAGLSLIADGDQALASQGITDPERWTAMQLGELSIGR